MKFKLKDDVTPKELISIGISKAAATKILNGGYLSIEPLNSRLALIYVPDTDCSYSGACGFCISSRLVEKVSKDDHDNTPNATAWM